MFTISNHDIRDGLAKKQIVKDVENIKLWRRYRSRNGIVLQAWTLRPGKVKSLWSFFFEQTFKPCLVVSKQTSCQTCRRTSTKPQIEFIFRHRLLNNCLTFMHDVHGAAFYNRLGGFGMAQKTLYRNFKRWPLKLFWQQRN